MTNRLQRLILPRVIQKREAQRQYMTRVILTMMGSVLSVSFIIIAIGWGVGVFPGYAITRMASMLLPVLLGGWLAFQGHWRWANYIPPIVLFSQAVYSTYLLGPATLGVLFYVLTIILTAMLQDSRAQWRIVVLCLVGYLIASWLYGERSLDELATLATMMGGLFIGIALLQWFSNSLLEQALTQARVKNKELEQQIIERQRTEKALRESEALFHSLVESMPQNVFSKDLQGRFTFANQHYCATEGKSLADIIGKTDSDLHPLDLAEKYRKDDLYVIETEQVLEAVEEHQPINGIKSYVQVIKAPIYDFRDQVSGVLGVFWDITERKQAETEIQRLQHLLQNITDSMPSALITMDQDGKVLTWNPAAEALTGRKGDQVQGQSLWQTCPELSRYRDLFEQAVDERQVTHRYGEQLATKDGIICHDVSVFPLEANKLEGVVLRIDDVTQRVQLEEMMLQSAKMASVGGLAAGVAHEVNNPLGAILQSTQILQMALDTERARIRERLQACGVDPQGLDCYLQERGLLNYLEGIRDTGARAAKIVSDLLSFSRKATSNLTSHDLNLLIEQTLELAAVDYDLKKRYDFRDIEIVRELTPDLSPVLCDRQQIQQVILNLVRNAAQAMAGARDEWRPQLTLRTLRQDEWVRLEVEDNGPGIPEAIRERLFEPFFTTKDVGEGVGLGLWLCWSIVVERHGGRIWSEPVIEGGTRFVVELPAAITGQD